MNEIIKTLQTTHSAIESLEPDAFGWGMLLQEGVQVPYSERDKLLNDIAGAIKHAEAVKAHRIKMYTAGF